MKNTKALSRAIDDTQRFFQRAKEELEEAYEASENDDVAFSEPTLKMIRRLSLDVTHAMKDLRDSIETKVGEE